MANPLILSIAFQSPKIDVAKGVYEEIEKRIVDAQTFRIDTPKVTWAGVDFIVILTSASAIATIANLLYDIWKTHRKKGDLYVFADLEKQIEITISEKTSMKEIKEFQTKINIHVARKEMSSRDKDVLWSIKHENIWINTKKKKGNIRN